MPNLLLRDVPEETVARLKEMARARRTSMNSVAVAELVAAVRTDANARLLAELPDLGVEQASIVEDLLAERIGRAENPEQAAQREQSGPR